MRFDTINLPKFLAPEGVAIAIEQALPRDRGVEGAVTRGADLAEAADYCTARHALLLDHRVLFDGPAPVGREAIRHRLERMVHAPRNPQVVQTILTAASREEIVVGVVDDRKQMRTERISLIASLPILAGQLASAQVTHPEFVGLLLRGELGSARDHLPAGGWPDLSFSRAMKLLRDLGILWSLHDLQVIAARLHQSIYQPTGVFAQDDLAPMKVGSVCASVQELRRAQGAIRAALGRNHRPITGHEFKEWTWLLGFIKKHDLENLAHTRAREAGVVIDAANGNAPSSPAVMRKIQDLLTHLDRTVGQPIGEAFEVTRKAKVRSPGDIARWRQLRQKNRRLATPGAPAKVPGKKALFAANIAQLQFGMEPTVALAYAIILFVLRIEKIDDAIGTGGHELTVEIPTRCALTQAQVRSIDALMTTYRAAILRDVGHLQDAADTPCPAIEALGSSHSANDPLLPPTGGPLLEKDATLGRGVSLMDKIPGLDPFSYDRGNDNSARSRRPGRPAVEAARALIAQEPLNPLFDLTLHWRLRPWAHGSSRIAD